MRDDEPWAELVAFIVRVSRSSRVWRGSTHLGRARGRRRRASRISVVITGRTRLVLDDGRYDAFVVWVDARDDGAFGVELTITTGIHKGEVVELVAARLPLREPLDLVGLPCTLVVTDGVPSIEP